MVRLGESESESGSSCALRADGDGHTLLATGRVRVRRTGDDDNRCGGHASHGHRGRSDEHPLQSGAGATTDDDELGVCAAVGKDGRRVTQNHLTRDAIGIYAAALGDVDGVIDDDLAGVLQSGRVIDDTPGTGDSSIVNSVKDNEIGVSPDRGSCGVPGGAQAVLRAVDSNDDGSTASP